MIQASQIIAHTISVLKMVKLLYLMTMRELNGSELAGFIKERQAKQVRALGQAWHINPRLAIVTDVEHPVIETISWLLAGSGVDLKGKKVAIVGRGRLVGAPLEKMWLKSGVDVTVFEKGDDLSQLINYDIIVSATGVPGLIKSQMIKAKTVVVDAGTASENGKIVGDVSEEVRQRNDVILTPKKGGVGPLTVSALFDNVITACLKIANQSKN